MRFPLKKKMVDEKIALEVKAREALEDIYGKLTPWQKCQVARHPERPHFSDFIKAMFEHFTPFVGGSLSFGEDPAIQAGLASFRGPQCPGHGA